MTLYKRDSPTAPTQCLTDTRGARERPLRDVEAACYSCCSVGPGPTVGGQHYHGHLTRQGTPTEEGGL